MGHTRICLSLLLWACGKPPVGGAAAAELPDRVVADFEKAVLTSKDAFLELFDFAAVGKYEKLLHRYDVLGRAELSPETRAAWENETPVPFTALRERRNVGNFYPRFVQRTIGSGRCRAVEPADAYAQALGRPFEPLPPEHQAYDPLRLEVNALIENGGIVALTCEGGRGGIALVYTRTSDPRGYRLITMYDDWGLAAE
jgi:hypothetical protein